MCTYQTLHINDNGYVVKCNCCSHFQVAFGTSILVLTKSEFIDFCEVVSGEASKCIDDGFPLSKSIFIPTKSKEIALVFSPKEIENLNQILIEAGLLLQAYELLNNIEPNAVN